MKFMLRFKQIPYTRPNLAVLGVAESECQDKKTAFLKQCQNNILSKRFTFKNILIFVAGLKYG